MKYFILFLTLFLLVSTGCKKKKNNIQPRDPSFEKMSEEDARIREQMPEEINEENHSLIMDLILGKPKHHIKQIGILVYDGVNDLDFMGPRYVLGQTGSKVQLIALHPGSFKTVMNVEIIPNTVIDSVDHLDILVVPGGFTGTIEATYDERVLSWVRKIDSTTLYTASVCTGGWILGAAGLLEGRKATTNWYRADKFMKKYGATYSGERYTSDGKYWTSAGVTAGIDMSLAIVNDNWGRKYTQGIMLDMEYSPEPPIVGGTPDKTGWLVEWMMNAMYDAGVNPLIDSLEKEKSARNIKGIFK